MNDNWWTAIRNEVYNYNDFRQLFKSKYWSESIQNIIRDNLCNGKYDPNRGQTPTAYFLGKVCLARNLEPRIPEECLITKRSHHFEEGIIRARLCGQVKTIGAMEALLESYEQESYYRRSRSRMDAPFDCRPDATRDHQDFRANREEREIRDNRDFHDRCGNERDNRDRRD